MYCQKCRTPLKLDSSLELLNPAAFELLVSKHSLDPELHVDPNRAPIQTLQAKPSTMEPQLPLHEPRTLQNDANSTIEHLEMRRVRFTGDLSQLRGQAASQTRRVYHEVIVEICHSWS